MLPYGRSISRHLFSLGLNLGQLFNFIQSNFIHYSTIRTDHRHCFWIHQVVIINRAILVELNLTRKSDCYRIIVVDTLICLAAIRLLGLNGRKRTFCSSTSKILNLLQSLTVLDLHALFMNYPIALIRLHDNSIFCGLVYSTIVINHDTLTNNNISGDAIIGLNLIYGAIILVDDLSDLRASIGNGLLNLRIVFGSRPRLPLGLVGFLLNLADLRGILQHLLKAHNGAITFVIHNLVGSRKHFINNSTITRQRFDLIARVEYR